MQEMYHPSDLAAMDPLVLMKNLDHVRMTSRRLSYILQQQVHLYTPEANQLREQIDRYVERSLVSVALDDGFGWPVGLTCRGDPVNRVRLWLWRWIGLDHDGDGA